MARITVNAPDSQYDIVIEAGILKRFEETRRAAVVTNVLLAPLYGQALVDHLPDAMLIAIPDGEQHKTLETVATLYGAFVMAGLDRRSVVIGLGGGVLGDTAGFAAATYLRGVSLIQAPTTLLSMVDSSVGGKVGVDLPQGKNLVGAFKQPERVLIDPEVLRTLPAREWRCGMGEVLKHGLLADPALLDPALHTPSRAEELITRAVRVKVDVVQRDPYEQGERAHLNLGHTFAHAIEQVSGYRWSHGEAVGVGLLAAAMLSQRLGLCGSELVERVGGLLTHTGLPTRTGGLDPQAVYAAMATDKKWFAGRSRFVLLRGVAQPLIVENVEAHAVLEVLEALQ
jgi:3-dehydroquinate synthase